MTILLVICVAAYLVNGRKILVNEDMGRTDENLILWLLEGFLAIILITILVNYK